MDFVKQLSRKVPKKSISGAPALRFGEHRLDPSGIQLTDMIDDLVARVGGRKVAAEIMGVAPTTLDNYRSGTTEPRILEFLKLSTAAQISIAQLFPPKLQGLLPALYNSGPEVAVPRYDLQASAGAGKLVASYDVREYFAVGRDWLRRNLPPWAPPNAVVGILEGSGDSMEPTIRDGDLIMVVQDVDWRIVERGGVFVFSLDGDRLLLKRLQVMTNGDLSIISDNKNYAVETIPFADLQHRVIVHGHVFFVGGKPRSL